MSKPATQINYLTISKDKELGDSTSDAGKLWVEALDLLEQYDGFRRLYWGRSPEDWTKVQLHIGKFATNQMANPEMTAAPADAHVLCCRH